MSNVAIFASGSGSNAENIIHFFRPKPEININLVLSNKADAKVLKRAKEQGVESYVFDREEFYKSDSVLLKLQSVQIDFIVLAGFLWLVPEYLIKAYPNRIINIHPALLPKYGGKGMYGSKVHEAVVANKEKESGISVHYVNERYDEGNIIHQAKCEVHPGDSAADVASKIHVLEYEHFPKIIEQVISMQ